MITAIDVGASKTLIAQFDHTGKIVNRVRFETQQDQNEFYSELHSVLGKLNDVRLLSVGIPGIVDSLGVIRRCGVLPWEDFDLTGMLVKDFNCTVLIENDAKLAGLSEANSLSPVPELCLYITVSTGIGEGVMENGRLVRALRYSEAGHMVVWDGEAWKSWQDIASGRVIKSHFGKFAKDITDPNDWQWVCEKLTIGLLALIPTLQPDTIIIGGSIGTYFDRYGKMLETMLNKRLPKFIKRPLLLGAKRAEEAVIYGCYYHATHQQDR